MQITFLASILGWYYKNDLNFNKSTKERIKKMNIFELSRKSLIVMLLSLMALVMLPGCSSTEETPATDTGTDTGSLPEQDGRNCEDECGVIPGQSYDECMAVCD